MPERGSTVDLVGWSGGLRKSAHPSLLDPNELTEALNIELGPRGEVQLRKGYQPYLMDGTTQTGVGETYVWCACPPTPNALPNAPDPIVAVQADGDVDVWPYDDAVENITAAGDYGPKLVAMNDTYYLTSSSASVTPVKITISGVPVVTAVNLTRWAATSDQTNQFPSARTLLVAYERVFAGGVVATPNEGLSRLYFSEPLLPESWSTTNFIDVGPDDSEGITALKFFADQIIIFKQRSIWGISGSDFSTVSGLSLYKIADVGAVNEQSVVEMPQGLLFLDAVQGIFLWDGSQIHNVGEPIWNYVKDGWNSSSSHKTNSWRNGDKAYVSVPWGNFTDPTMTFVYDAVLQGWTQHTYGFRAVARRFVTEGAEDDTAGNVERIIGVGGATFEEGAPVSPGNPIPAGVILAWPDTAASIPANWDRVTALDDRYPKGIPSSVTEPGTEAGAETHNHTLPTHNHSLNHSHTTTGDTPAGTTGVDVHLDLGANQLATMNPTNHDHTTPSTGTATVNSGSTAPLMVAASSEDGIPHKDVIFVESDGTDTTVPTGALAIAHAETVPSGWEEEDSDETTGRPSYWRGATAAGDGSLTKVPSAPHSHQIGAHTHPGTTHTHTSAQTGIGFGQVNQESDAGAPTRSVADNNHKHSITIGSASTGALGAGGGGDSTESGDALTSDPSYRTTNFVRSVTGETFVGLIGMWLGALNDIPFGWALCDGSGGRPNFLGRYPRYKGSLGLNEVGGGGGHTHSGFSHSDHTASAHDHSMAFGQATTDLIQGTNAPLESMATGTHTHSSDNTDNRTPTVGAKTHGTSSSEEAEPRHTEVAFIQLVEETDPALALDEGVMLLYTGSHDNDVAVEASVRTGYLTPESPLTLHRMRSVGLVVPSSDLDAAMNLYVDGDESAATLATTLTGNSATHTPRTRALNRARWRTLQLEWSLSTDGLEPASEYEWALSQATLEYSTLPSTRTTT